MTSHLLLSEEVLPLNQRGDFFRPGYVLLEDDRLVEIGSQSELNDRDFAQITDLGRRLVMPGLVNAHTHTPMSLFRGMAEPYSLFTFDGWYRGIRTLEAFMDGDMVPPAVAVSCAEMIRTGTTCFADQYFYMDKVVPAVRQSGLRASLAYGIVEMGNPEARVRELASARSFLESVRDDPRIHGWIGPHAFFVDNSPEAIQMELALAEEFQTGLHIHLGTSGEEERHCRKEYGISAVTQMERLGILNYRLLAAHSITIPEEDFPALAAHPFTAVIAASACMRSGAQAAALKAMLAAGINAALGTDNVANNNSYDLFKEMQLTGKLMAYREKQPSAVPARQIVEMATLGGARGLGLEREIGSLEPGKKADLIALDLDEIGWGPRGGQDIYTALVYAVSGLHIRDVMVDGRWLLREGQFQTIDYQSASRDLDEAQAVLQRRVDRMSRDA